MKKIVLMAATAFLSLSVSAQQSAIQNYGFGDNWFIQGQLGASYTFSENSKEAGFGDLISPHVALSLGKHFSPVAGARLQLGGWEAKSNRLLANNKLDSYKINYYQANVDGLLNLTNLFCTYQGDKAFNLYGIMGLGYVHTFGKAKDGLDATNSIVPRVGLQFDFRMTDDLSLNLEATGNLMNEDFNGQAFGKKNDATANVLLGLTYRFNRGGFNLVDVADPAMVASLNDKINQQKNQLTDRNKEIDRLKSELARKPEPTVVTKEVKQDTEVLMNAVVVFRLGSAKLEQNQDINIYNAAKYLKENPNVKVTVTGYADKATGTPVINQRLSEQRANAVADIMVSKFGIARNRINVQASGDKEQPFENDAWNRVVIFTANN
ncbi:MAG: hypothetical protein RL662_1817 [Bacteroidota bacterium]|jgi:outer membrane protein OmpA-like peptidoglycan-associated protein